MLAGTWCDIGKWCIEGQCIQEETITSGSHKPKCNSTYTAVKSNKDPYCVTDEDSCLWHDNNWPFRLQQNVYPVPRKFLKEGEGDFLVLKQTWIDLRLCEMSWD